MDHEKHLRKVAAEYDEGVIRLRRKRDDAVVVAHNDGGLSFQAIAVACGMSMENVRRIYREHRKSRR